MDVEFITDSDTDALLLAWFSRSRREVMSGSVFIGIVALLGLVEVRILWDGASRRSFAFVASMLLIAGAIAITALSRDPDRKPPMKFPQTELLCIGLLIASLIGTFEHRPSIITFMLLAGALAACALLFARFAYLFPILRDLLPPSAHALHVHVDGEGIEYTVRPHQARRIPWTAVRSMEGDGQALYIVTGLTPIIIPRRAFATDALWRAFIESARTNAAELRKQRRSPISKHVPIFQTRTAPVAASPYDPSHDARRPRRGSRRPSGRK
jgi:hypothetical protein